MEPSRIEMPQSPAACSRAFSGRDVLSEVMGPQSKRLVCCSSESARGPANQSSRLACAKAQFKAASAQRRAPRESYWPNGPSVIDMQRTQLFSAEFVSERASSKSASMKSSRLPSNQLLEGTPPCCALRRPSAAR